jgi:hypothetical protein
VPISIGVALRVALLQENAGLHRKTQDKQLVSKERYRAKEEDTGQADSPLKIP